MKDDMEREYGDRTDGASRLPSRVTQLCPEVTIRATTSAGQPSDAGLFRASLVGMQRRKWLAVLLGLLALVLLAGLVSLGDVSTARPSASRVVDGWSSSVASTTAGSRVSVENEALAGRAAGPSPMQSGGSTTALDEAEQARRAELREQILAAQRSRAAEATKLARPSEPELERDAKAESEGLVNHVEGYDRLVEELNKDFLPLSDECIADALARAPSLTGELAIEFELVVDEELGAVIETVNIANENQVHDPQLQECVRESLLSMVLSPGAADGSAALVIKLLVESEA